tara:strand:+ start:1655 stop:1864 length:210 start_codon:yes stop_codon:yes gene_type:complete
MTLKDFLLGLLTLLLIGSIMINIHFFNYIKDYRKLSYDAIELAKSWRQRYIDCNEGIIVSDSFIVEIPQ